MFFILLLQALIAAVNETSEEDIRDALKTQTENQLALVPRGPTLVKDTVAYNTTITTDDTVCRFKYFYYHIDIRYSHENINTIEINFRYSLSYLRLTVVEKKNK